MLKLNCLFKLAIIAFLSLNSAACGYKMRGNLTMPNYLQALYISPHDPYEAFQRELRYRLSRLNIAIVGQPGPDTTILEVSKPEISRQLLAESTSGQGQRVKLSFTIRYKLSTKDKNNSREQRSITRSRELSKTNNMLLSDDNEEQLIKKELLNESLNELLRQLSSRPVHKESVLDSSTSDGNPC